MTKNDRANFGSKLGVILASAGSAVFRDMTASTHYPLSSKLLYTRHINH